MVRLSRSTVAQIALVGVAAVWGATFVMVQDAVAVLPVLSFLAYRFLAAAAIVAVPFRREVKALGAAGWRAGLLMALFLTAGYVLQTVALLHTTAANAGFITGLFVILTPMLAAALLHRAVDRATWTGAVVSAVGLALLAGVGSNWHPLGDALALGCAVAFAAHILATDAGVRHHPVGGLLVVQLGACGLVCLLGAIFTGHFEFPRGATVWSALLVTAVLASAAGFWVQSYAQRHAPPARTALILASEPAFAGLFAVTLQGDRLSLLSWIGALMILTAILVVELLPLLRAQASQP